MPASLRFCTHLLDAVVLPLINGRQATLLDQKRRRIIDVVTFTLDTRLLGFNLSLANTLARLRFRVDVHHR
ncbi:MAG TPA: hypothetical protein VGF65_12350 [Mycobacterium sp.]|jgi:hypothetical protein